VDLLFLCRDLTELDLSPIETLVRESETELKPQDLFKLVEIDFQDVVTPWLTAHFDTLMPEEVCLLLMKGN